MRAKVYHIESIPGWLKVELPAWATRTFGIIAFTALLSVSAHIKVFLPGNPVPVTLQTMFALLAGAMLGPAAGATAVAAYLGLGLTGMPFFATDYVGGLAYLTGPTGGYLFGFFAAALFAGFAVPRLRSGSAKFAALGLADLLLLACGAWYLSLWMGTGVEKALLIGIVPFIPGEILKTAAAFAILKATGPSGAE